MTFYISTLEVEGRSHGNVELVYSSPSSIQSAGLSSLSMELSADSVQTLWEAAERKVKGRDDCSNGRERVTEEMFLEMISEMVDNGTHIQLKVTIIIYTLLPHTVVSIPDTLV